MLGEFAGSQEGRGRTEYVPEIDDEVIQCIIGRHIRNELVEIIIPTGPIAIVTGEWGGAVLGSIGTP
jgi:hypothetical protein